MPGFTSLRASDILHKSPGEVVTVVDRDAEIFLAEGLSKIDPSGRVLGEEAASEFPELMEKLDSGRVWIVDPIDGTANFAAGNKPFGVMIALAVDGVVEAGWIYDPATRRLCSAKRGAGAFVNQQSIEVRIADNPKPVISLASQFMPEWQRKAVSAHCENWAEIVPIPRCAAAHYPRICLERDDAALFQRTLPWDHAAGALFLQEAGGYVTRWDGSEYHFHDGKSGIIAAASKQSWELAIANLICPETGLSPECDLALLPQS
ncbi:inositol monophosphatase family protein [Sphingorhabdus arenilitoris]|uniref:Inositol monophosphatase family protein n=1 Tax=Sphingorhabdus arenilitoris TaxID=1490041 RepID=A0ABV8RD83_9SPHN